MKTKIIRNPDKQFVKDLKQRIKANNGYCPCQLLKNEDTKCPCKIFRETNECECGLYISVEESDPSRCNVAKALETLYSDGGFAYA